METRIYYGTGKTWSTEIICRLPHTALRPPQTQYMINREEIIDSTPIPDSLAALPPAVRDHVMPRLHQCLVMVQTGMLEMAPNFFGGRADHPAYRLSPDPDFLNQRFSDTLQAIQRVDHAIQNPTSGINHGHNSEFLAAFHALVYQTKGQRGQPDWFFDFHRLNEPQRKQLWTILGVDKSAAAVNAVSPGETRMEIYTRFTPTLGITLHVATHRPPADPARLRPNFHPVVSHLHSLSLNPDIRLITRLTYLHFRPQSGLK